MNRLLAALAGRLFPARGRPQHPPGPDDTVILTRVPPWYGHHDTRFDIPPFRVRPYLGDEDGESGWPS